MPVFYANGKLLLTGEYYVLEGAEALALPTRFGQYLSVEAVCLENSLSEKNENPAVFLWQSLDHDAKIWWEGQVELCGQKISVLSKNSNINSAMQAQKTAQTLEQILQKALQLNPNFACQLSRTTAVETRLTFPRNWGLGSSSTLIANIAHWAGCNPFRLLFETMGGSGYDIACAQAETPIFYKKNGSNDVVCRPADFNPPFSQQLFFLYLNKKQDSRQAIAHFYRQTKADRQDVATELERINEQLLQCTELGSFEQLLAQHEAIIAHSLGLDTAQSLFFKDYWGQIKSLGAWGGDFLLVCSNRPLAETADYFAQKGFYTLLTYREMIK